MVKHKTVVSFLLAVHAVSVWMHREGVCLKTISKGFIPDKLSELSKPLPDKIREVIAFRRCYESNVNLSKTYGGFDVKPVNIG